MLRTVTGLALAISVSAASVVTADPASSRTSLTGQVVQRAADVRDGAGGRTRDVYFTDLVTRDRTVRLRLPAKSRRLKTGTTVTVSGDMDANTMNAANVQVVASASEPAATGTTRVLVILAHWSQPDSVTTTTARDQIFGEGNRWFAEASFGQLSLAGDVTPWVTIPAPGGCDYLSIMSSAESAARTAGYTPANYDRRIVYFPATWACSWTGLADVGGGSSWLNGAMTLRTSVHEQGHNYGLYHAHAAYCEGTEREPVIYSAALDGCGFDEYGDPADVMGGLPWGGNGHFSSAHKHQLGWLGARAAEVSSCATGVALAPHEAATTSTPQAASVAGTGSSRYWFEYRQPVGFDSDLPTGITGGVSILVTDPHHGGMDGPSSLDATPASEHYHDDRALLPGSSVTLPGDVTVTAGPATAAGTSLSLSSPNPSVPKDARVSVASDGGIPVSWSAPECAGSSAIASYIATATSRDGSVDTRAPAGNSVTFPPSDYDRTFRVAAKNATRTGPAVTVAPSAPRSVRAGVVVYSNGPQTTVRWARPLSNGGHTIRGYRVSARPTGGGAAPAPQATSFLETSLPLTMGESYEIQVTPFDESGAALQASAPLAFTPRRTTVEFAQAPAHLGWSSTKPVIDLSSNFTDTRYTCRLDDVPMACSSAPMTLSLAPGSHSFYAYGDSPAGGPSTSITRFWHVDGAAPTVAVSAPAAPFTLGTTAGARWSATEPSQSSGVASYDVRYRVAPWNGAFGAMVYPATWQKTTATTKAVPAVAGSTYCFSVRARDRVGNVSGWSGERCTARVLDDTALSASSGWRRHTADSRYYLSTMTRSTVASASLTRSGAQVARVAVIATRCPTCGSVRVYVGSTLIGTLNLYAATTQRRVVLPLAKRAVVTGTVTVRTATAGKTVEIDGLGISRV